jgi:hypothetical protein
MVHQQAARIAPSAIEDRRDFAVTTQAAARTLALVVAELGGEFE